MRPTGRSLASTMLFAAPALQGTVARSAQQASECCLDPSQVRSARIARRTFAARSSLSRRGQPAHRRTSQNLQVTGELPPLGPGTGRDPIEVAAASALANVGTRTTASHVYRLLTRIPAMLDATNIRTIAAVIGSMSITAAGTAGWGNLSRPSGTMMAAGNDLGPCANRRGLLYWAWRLWHCHLRTRFVKTRSHLWHDYWRRWGLCQ